MLRPPRDVAAHVWDSLLDHSYSVAAHLGYFLAGNSVTASAVGPLSPVLLIPGVYEPWTFLRPVGERLARKGFSVHYLPELGHNLLDIPSTARLAFDYVDGHDLRGVTVVAHSKGGIVGKQLLIYDERAGQIGDGRIVAVVAINSLFTGSRYAGFTPDRALREFRPNGTVLKMLSARADLNGRITSISAARHPRLYGNCYLEGATNIAMPGYGHFLPLSDPAVIDAVIAAVEATITASTGGVRTEAGNH